MPELFSRGLVLQDRVGRGAAEGTLPRGGRGVCKSSCAMRCSPMSLILSESTRSLGCRLRTSCTTRCRLVGCAGQSARPSER